MLDWFMWSALFLPMSSAPVGIRDWPRRGGVMRQHARLVDAADLLIGEWPFVPREKAAAKPVKKESK